MSQSRSQHPFISVRARRASARGGVREWTRMGLLVVAMVSVVLVPFALWGGAMDRAAPAWLAQQEARAWISVLGVALLVADVVAPVPSSLVCMGLCWSLGPLWGGVAVGVGTTLAFATGYGIGRLVPEARLRAWIGADAWDRARLRARRHALWWIAASRPLPLFAEVTALLAGAWRVPVAAALGHAALASAAMGATYGGAASLGRDQPSAILTLFILLALPAVSWLVHRLVPRSGGVMNEYQGGSLESGSVAREEGRP